MIEHLTGLIAAVHTPMKEDGSVDLDTIPRQARCMADNGVSGVFVCGSTGEGLSLTLAERLAVAEAWKDAAPEGLDVLVHVGHNCMPEAREIAEHAERVIGARAIAAVAPTYFTPSNVDDLIAYCAEIASAAPNTPFYYYHIPIKTGLTFKAFDVLRVAAERVPTFAGIKFTHEDLMDLRRCLTYEGGKHNILFGRDEILLAGLALGVKGGIGSTYNFATPLYRRIINAYNAGDMATAQREQSRAIEMIATMQRFGGAVAIKQAMKAIGLDCGPSRLPQRAMTNDVYEAFHAELTAIGFFDYCSKLNS